MLERLINQANTIAIGGHLRPDGDSVGACMGLMLYIEECFPEKQVHVYLEEIPEAFHFLKGTERIRHEIQEEISYDLFVSLDCGDKSRLGFSLPLFEKAKNTMCIDHHISNLGFGDENYILPNASSTSEVICDFLDMKKITKEMAEAIYMGIVHDTGVFQYSCTSPETMCLAAELLRKGIDASGIIDATYYEKTFAQNQILGRALLESIRFMDNKCIVSAIHKKTMELFGVEPKDLEGIVSQLRITKDVEVAIFLYETEANQWKVSLRSKKYIDVSKTASYFGGGGHVRAAGCSMPGTFYDVVDNLSRQLEIQFEENEEA